DRRESYESCYRSPSLQGARCQIAKRSSNLALLFAFLLNQGPRPDAHERNCRHRLPLWASQLTAVKAIVQFDLYGRDLVMPCLTLQLSCFEVGTLSGGLVSSAPE